MHDDQQLHVDGAGDPGQQRCPATFSCGYNVPATVPPTAASTYSHGRLRPYAFLWSTGATTEDVSALGQALTA
ncbi:MAG: hypothetical protein IPP17_19530 [Bacteroidetes bacterium]|nr:hypothetical protein [Bacteroidota bacterium]